MFIFINLLTYSIQIDLGTCLNRGYMIFAYIKSLCNVHKASPPVVASSVLERKACCVFVAVAVIIIVC